MDISIIIAIFIAVGSAIFSLINICQTRSQINRQAKISSANLIQTLRSPWRKNDEFKKIFQDIPTEESIRLFLKQMEIIAIYWKEKTLDEHHIREMFLSDLELIRKKDSIKNYLDEHTSSYHYTNLNNLLEKSKKWN